MVHSWLLNCSFTDGSGEIRPEKDKKSYMHASLNDQVNYQLI